MEKKLGIWGFGVVGKSALKFFSLQFKNCDIGIWDQRRLSNQEINLIKSFNASFFNHINIDLKTFFNRYDHILVSPGIDIKKIIGKHYSSCYTEKFFCELDIFSDYFEKKTVSITGSLGKTTIITLLHSLSKGIGLKSVIGGNIGTGMLNLIHDQLKTEIAFLELSSFQLEDSKKFSPHIAVCNNFYPNHLDRHISLQDYFFAKFKIFKYQTKVDFALLNADFLFMEQGFVGKINDIKSKKCFVTFDFEKTLNQIKKLKLKSYAIFFVKNNSLFVSIYPFISFICIFNFSFLPEITFKENWAFILAILYLLNIDLQFFEKYFLKNKHRYFIRNYENVLEHRLEKFVSINGVEFYNDSKATIVEATYSALKILDKKERPIILILGGLNKGVDRKPFIKKLPLIKNLKYVFCFGKKFKDFDLFPQYSSLKQLLIVIIKLSKSGDIVLFSPGGASFDLFDNYRHRGKVFKDLVLSLAKNN
ncbi:UDP-N-acetylmuramoyl-L-alanine--D-glutamate ligase [Candidatus Babeliales bacterium]|nr:UDP-N-acetylmuramoyl-L-alanine--D-glutamate ligase [Candidatus Babeliales bacterium]